MWDVRINWSVYISPHARLPACLPWCVRSAYKSSQQSSVHRRICTIVRESVCLFVWRNDEEEPPTESHLSLSLKAAAQLSQLPRRPASMLCSSAVIGHTSCMTSVINVWDWGSRQIKMGLFYSPSSYPAFDFTKSRLRYEYSAPIDDDSMDRTLDLQKWAP